MNQMQIDQAGENKHVDFNSQKSCIGNLSIIFVNLLGQVELQASFCKIIAMVCVKNMVMLQDKRPER